MSPLSQSEIAAIVNPGLNGWAALNGAEIEDDAVVGNNGYICQPLANQADKVTLGTSSQNPYYLQREFNNAGALEFDPATYWGCAPDVILSPEFVVPSAVDQGDVIELDGAASASTLMIPQANYQWNFGDGTTAVGPSVEHGYNKGGTYNITLTRHRPWRLHLDDLSDGPGARRHRPTRSAPELVLGRRRLVARARGQASTCTSSCCRRA